MTQQRASDEVELIIAVSSEGQAPDYLSNMLELAHNARREPFVALGEGLSRHEGVWNQWPIESRAPIKLLVYKALLPELPQCIMVDLPGFSDEKEVTFSGLQTGSAEAISDGFSLVLGEISDAKIGRMSYYSSDVSDPAPFTVEPDDSCAVSLDFADYRTDGFFVTWADIEHIGSWEIGRTSLIASPEVRRTSLP